MPYPEVRHSEFLISEKIHVFPFFKKKKKWLGAHKRLTMIYPPPLTNKAWFSSGSVWKRLDDPRDGTLARRGLWVWSLAILPACLINPSLGEIRDTQHGAIFLFMACMGNSPSRRAASLKPSLQIPIGDVETLEHLYSNHRGSVWVTDFWSVWGAS